MTLDPDIRTPTDYADAAPVEQAEPSQEDIEQVFSVAEAARAAGAWTDEEN